TASVNSALQRARATLQQEFPEGMPDAAVTPDERERALLDRYVSAWETGDLDRLVGVVRVDAVLSMPPLSAWYLGPEGIGSFLLWARREHEHLRLVRTGANRQPAFAVYVPTPDPGRWRPLAIQVLTLRDGAIASIVAFLDPRLFDAFGLSPLPG
ncbi:MAG: nuclear transport factor 2 family protein, partial [Candidatus Dormibacteraeota bacterium]|nr:nuclear transport factor 2 family protein [Candidatus Dormibacteraeota bacterium]